MTTTLEQPPARKPGLYQRRERITGQPVCLRFKWSTSRGRDTYGYNICTLYADGERVASCNGGGYDMKGTCLGDYLAARFPIRLRCLKPDDMPKHTRWQPELDAEGRPKYVGHRQLGKHVDQGRHLYGLTFHDPNYDAGKARIGRDCSDRTLTKPGESCEGQTVEQAEKAGNSFGLERLQAVYRASSPFPTRRHTVPSIDGACGLSSVQDIARAMGLSLEWLRGDGDTMLLREATRSERKEWKERASR